MKSIEYVLLAFISLFLFSINVYAYKEYEIGEIVSLNDTEFYVIKSSKSDDNYVTALKKEPLKTTEIQEYGEGHINRNIMVMVQLHIIQAKIVGIRMVFSVAMTIK